MSMRYTPWCTCQQLQSKVMSIGGLGHARPDLSPTSAYIVSDVTCASILQALCANARPQEQLPFGLPAPRGLQDFCLRLRGHLGMRVSVTPMHTLADSYAAQYCTESADAAASVLYHRLSFSCAVAYRSRVLSIKQQLIPSVELTT